MRKKKKTNIMETHLAKMTKNIYIDNTNIYYEYIYSQDINIIK